MNQALLDDWCLGLITHLCEIQVPPSKLQITFTSAGLSFGCTTQSGASSWLNARHSLAQPHLKHHFIAELMEYCTSPENGDSVIIFSPLFRITHLLFCHFWETQKENCENKINHIFFIPAVYWPK